MPTYEYACEKCGIFEVFQSMSEDALKRCPTCESKKVQRLISGGAGVIFKGDGFWETDYNRSDDYKKQAKGETATDSSGGQASGKESAPEPQAKGAPAQQAEQVKKPQKKSDPE